MKRTAKRAKDAPLTDTLTTAPPISEGPVPDRALPWENGSSDFEDETRDRDISEEPAAEGAEVDTHGPDDALGLYLRQMGAIPLLTRDQELALAERLEYRRTRYRHVAMANWRTLAAVADTFERIMAGQLALDPSIDVVTTLGLSRDRILQRIPHNVRTLRLLIESADADFRALQRITSPGSQARLRRDLARRLRKSIILSEELSPRIDLLDPGPMSCASRPGR